MEVLFCYPRSAGHFSIHNCFAVWVRFLGALKRPPVVPEPRFTGPCGTRLALLLIKRTSKWEVLFLLSEKCGALLDTQLLCSLGSISRDAKAPLGRASAKVHRTLWHPSRALLDNKKDFRMGSPFLLFEKCEALLETQLLGSLGSISRRAKALLGRARAKVHWTLWHPSRALLDNKRDLFHITAPQLSGFL